MAAKAAKGSGRPPAAPAPAEASASAPAPLVSAWERGSPALSGAARVPPPPASSSALLEESAAGPQQGSLPEPAPMFSAPAPGLQQPSAGDSSTVSQASTAALSGAASPARPSQHTVFASGPEAPFGGFGVQALNAEQPRSASMPPGWLPPGGAMLPSPASAAELPGDFLGAYNPGRLSMSKWLSDADRRPQGGDSSGDVVVSAPRRAGATISGFGGGGGGATGAAGGLGALWSPNTGELYNPFGDNPLQRAFAGNYK